MISFAAAAKLVRAAFKRTSDPAPDFSFVAGALVGPDGTISKNALTASTTSDQAGGLPLTSAINRFTTVGTSGDSALLPVAANGRQLTVINATATSMDVFPAVGDAVNALSANAAFALAGGTSVTFWSAVAGHWNTLASPAATFSPSVTGTLSLTDATTPAISLAAGSTNTGTITINGKTSGKVVYTTADATAQTITDTFGAQTVGAVTLTRPDFAGVNDTYAFITKAQTLGNKTLTAPVINGATSASGNFDLSGSGGTQLTPTGAFTVSGIEVNATSTRSGPGAVPITKSLCKLTTTGIADALTLANGVDGQILTIIHDVDGGSAVLTPTTKTGFSTVTFTNVGETVTLKYATTRGWFITGLFLAVAA